MEILGSLVRSVLLVAGLLAGGSEEQPVELPRGDACGEASFWAATGSGDLAVTVRIDARDRSATEPTTREFTLPDPGVVVEVLEGERLWANFCTDAISTASEPRTRQAAVAGAGTVTLGATTDRRLDPFGTGCGATTGELELTGLEAEDGTTFAPIRVTSGSIGCYYG